MTPRRSGPQHGNPLAVTESQVVVIAGAHVGVGAAVPAGVPVSQTGAKRRLAHPRERL